MDGTDAGAKVGMRALRLITCLWPGLAALWWRGSALGLLAAASFAALFNVVFVATFIWPELFGPMVPTVGWFAVAVIWLIAALRSRRTLPVDSEVALASDEVDLFVQAQAEYLRGHWLEAEKLLIERLSNAPGDAESILLLATLYRHRRRQEQADEQLARLERLDAGLHWRWEVRRERRLLDQLDAAEPDEPAAGAAAA